MSSMPVEQLGPEVRPQLAIHFRDHDRALPVGHLTDGLGAQVRRHDDERVPEVDRAALARR
jgi:hypothetical protein